MRKRRAGWASGWALAGELAVGYGLWKAWQRLRAESMRGKVVFISGGSRGLGLALARELTRQGARLVLCARDEQELERARLDVEHLGGDVMVGRGNVADKGQMEALVAQAIERFGRIDVLINNAGIIQVGPFDTMTVVDFGQSLNVNFWGPLNAIWAVLPHMRAVGGGQIVNITSIGGKVSVPHLLPYGAAKAAFVSLSEGLQAELAHEGIAVTTVVPGLMRTGSPVNAFFKGEAEKEYGWFSVGDSLLATSTSAEHAARRIVMATRMRKGEVVLSWQAKLLRLAHGMFPNLVIAALARVNRMLPAGGPASPTDEALRPRRGRDLKRPATAQRLTKNMAGDAARLNQMAVDGHYGTNGLRPIT